MNTFEKQYHKLLARTVNEGENDDRKNHYSSFSLPSGAINLDLTEDDFPVISGRKFDITNPLVEIIGTLRGVNNSLWYKKRGCNFWSKFGVSKTVEKTANKTDEELVNEFCSLGGTITPMDPLYLERFLLLKERDHLEGRKLIDKSGITFWKNIVEIEKGEMGPTHAYNWRNWRKYNGDNFDQLRYVFDKLKSVQESQQLTITGVIPSGMEEFHERFEKVLSLKRSVRFPCHLSHTYCTVEIPFKKRIELLLAKHPEKRMNKEQYERFSTTVGKSILTECQIPKYYLDLTWVQKNWDLMLGLPINVVSYAAMLMMMAKLQNMVPRHLTGIASSVHVYKNHLTAAGELIQRYERKSVPKCKPQLIINLRNDVEFIDQFEISDFTLDGYKSLPSIRFDKLYDKH